MKNLLLEEVKYKINKTKYGVWRRYLYPTGACFEEFRAYRTLMGLPLIHYTVGINPETGKRVIAKGFIGVGKIATGVIAIGHAAFGVIAIGQLGIGIILGLGQASVGFISIGQLAIGLLFGLGQFATGHTVIAQLGIGHYVIVKK